MNPVSNPQDKSSGIAGEVKATTQEMADKARAAVHDVTDKAKEAMRDSGVQGDYEALKSDLHNLRQDVMKMMGEVTDKTSSKVKEVASDLIHSGQNVVDVAKEKGGALAESLESQVKDRPLVSMLIAFGAGLFLSRMMDRR